MTPRLSRLVGLALLAVGLSAVPAFASTALVINPVHALAAPDTSFGTVLELGANTKVGILWCGPKNFDWCLIQFHKKAGWVHTADLQALDNSGLPIDGPNKVSPGPAGPGAPGDPAKHMEARNDPPSHITVTGPLPGL